MEMIGVKGTVVVVGMVVVVEAAVSSDEDDGVSDGSGGDSGVV